MLDSKLWRADPVLWLGLSPLGVAIQRGNERLVDALIGTFLCNPNEAQAKQLGFPLHLLANLQGSCQQNVDSQTITRMVNLNQIYIYKHSRYLSLVYIRKYIKYYIERSKQTQDK